MKNSKILAFCMLLTLGGLLAPSSHAQQSDIIHPANDLERATVVVTVGSHEDNAHHAMDVVWSRVQAIGFTAGNCDIVTTFDVVVEYERWSYRPDVKESIKVVIAGHPYEGRLRHIGVYPNNINLACIDLSPLKAGNRVMTFPLSVAAIPPLSPDYRAVLSADDFGTPLLDEKGKVVFVLVGGHISSALGGAPVNDPEFISAEQLRSFLAMAKNVPRSGTRIFVQPTQ